MILRQYRYRLRLHFIQTIYDMDFSVFALSHFKAEQCFDCTVPGYLIVSPVIPVVSLADLPQTAQEELGPALAKTTGIIRNIINPLKIYCAQFGEEGPILHFHVFPRTKDVTSDFLRIYPEQKKLIHGPFLLDWARDRYRASKTDVWKLTMPVILALREEFDRISNRST